MFLICSIYRRPSNLDKTYLDGLNEALTHIADTSPSAHVWVAGDFNLPDINWEDSSTVSSTQLTTISEQLIEISDDHSLTQIVNKPTQSTPDTENILDLFFSNYPDMIQRHDVIPGLSDHDIPFLDVSTKISLNKKKPRCV